MWVVQVQKDLVDLSKHYVHEIDALVSLDRAECFALEKKKKKKKKKKKTRKNSYKVVRKSSVYGVEILCCVIYARAADLFVYVH